jgi:predicted signal transduction protein with EAL and GGDEF domain
MTGDLYATVVQALSASGLPPQRLELEITESLLIDRYGGTLATLHRLRNHGISIALDDFGTGYSSLTYLRQFPFDCIKIDQTFVAEMRRVPTAPRSLWRWWVSAAVLASPSPPRASRCPTSFRCCARPDAPKAKAF